MDDDDDRDGDMRLLLFIIIIFYEISTLNTYGYTNTHDEGKRGQEENWKAGIPPRCTKSFRTKRVSPNSH